MSTARFSSLGSILIILIVLFDQCIGAAPIDFNADIRPLLSSKCFECHGPDSETRKARLRLDQKAGLFGLTRKGKPVVSPGDAVGSALMDRLTAADVADRMPPSTSRHVMGPDEIDRIRQWIDAGADWRGHWAFTGPQPAPVPEVRNGDWCRDDIDRHVLRTLEREGQSPAPEADPAILLRRVYFDLTGLPPTLEALDAFEFDPSQRALGIVVDRLLMSSAYGERMASAWLDLARYADTYGYQSDVGRRVWPYRDWVVRAYNDNLRYDDFVTWQLAGDLLPDSGPEQRLATAFNRLHRQTNEGGSVEEEFRVEYVADRVHTFGTVMLGLTTECARCHDHKFDPISQREYYQLAAFFNNIDESGLYSHFTSAVPTPALNLPTPKQATHLAELEALVREREAALQAMRSTRMPAFEAWRDQWSGVIEPAGLQGRYPLDGLVDGGLKNTHLDGVAGGLSDGPRFVEGVEGQAVELSGDNNVHFPGVAHFSRFDPFSLVVWVNRIQPAERAVILHRSRAWTDAGSQGYQLLLEAGRPSWSLVHFWPGNAISIRAVKPIPVGGWTQLVVTSDGSARAAGLALYVNGEPAEVEVIRDSLTRSITGGGPGHLTVGQRFRDRGFKGGRIDDVQVYERALTPIEVARLHSPESQHEGLLAYYLSTQDEPWLTMLAELRDARRELAAARDRVPQIMTMREMPTPRETFVLGRGRYDSQGESVEPATPTVIGEFGAGHPPNRIGLAHWLTHPDHPLTARVAVNRLWMTVFGRGLVRTPGDFGSQGAPPSHPELLDMLAIDFINSGWDVKAMLRRLVLTSTYQQASGGAEALWRNDPDNRTLARGPAFRLTAEMLRDQALSASGLLVEHVGGPPVYPYQPPGLWKDKSGASYPQGTGDSLHRRSLYTYWKRTSPPPSMMMFDAAKRDVCVPQRASTSTPLQALVLLNDPQFVEAQRVLAQRAMREGGEALAQQIIFAFRSLTSRRPREAELEALLDQHALQRAAFERDPEAALALTNSTIEQDAGPQEAIELSAMTMVCAAIMSSDAAVVRR